MNNSTKFSNYQKVKIANQGELLPVMSRFREKLLKMSRHKKRALLVVTDACLLTAVVWFALCIRYNTFYIPPGVSAAGLCIAAPLITVAAMWWMGLYRMVTRFIGQRGNTQIIVAVLLSVVLWSVLLFMVGQHGIPRTAVVLYAIVGATVVLSSRNLVKVFLERSGVELINITDNPHMATLIYGANDYGIALLQAINQARDRYVVGFVDPSQSLWRQYAHCIKIYPPAHIERLIDREQVNEILIALPNRRERQRVLDSLAGLPVTVKILPTYGEFASDDVTVNSLRTIEVGDLIGRDNAKPDADLMSRCTDGKSILVTGAGGSIGSELVRQLAQRSPHRLILLDISESALYKIDLEIRELIQGSDKKLSIFAVLGSASDAALIDELITEHRVQVIYHAAAYKHVPIVERNAFSGLENNIQSTLVTAQSARKHSVERFVLVSTDKAVRPTSVMGASKRLAELILQAEASNSDCSTIFTIVRFGNVLESSGSVVPLFRRQIEAGGPVTVTDPNITRYFMSIPEAASLVIQAGAMGEGGEIFVLHMGEPVRIDDVARLMIRLANLKIRDGSNPDGDIEIQYIGLRPGEKLFEELQIGAQSEATQHPLISKCTEPYLPRDSLGRELKILQNGLQSRDPAAVMSVLSRVVEDYKASKNLEAEIESTTRFPPTSSVTVH